jgi:hypothetical protein
MGREINGPLIQICTDGAQNLTKSGRGGGVTGRQNKKSLPERGQSIDGPVYAAKAHCKDHLKGQQRPSWRALPMMARSMLGTAEGEKARGT